MVGFAEHACRARCGLKGRETGHWRAPSGQDRQPGGKLGTPGREKRTRSPDFAVGFDRPASSNRRARGHRNSSSMRSPLGSAVLGIVLALVARDAGLQSQSIRRAQPTLSIRRIRPPSVRCDRGVTHRAASVSSAQKERCVTVAGRFSDSKSTALAGEFHRFPGARMRV